MTQIIVDPSDLRRFAGALQELQKEMDGRRGMLAEQISDVRSFWNDGKYREFQRHSEYLLLELQGFSKMCDRYSEFLIKKARAAEAYLGA